MITTAAFSALAEPSRLQIVEILRHRPLPVGQIAERLRMRQPQVSKHLRVLSDAGLVQARPGRQKRIHGLRAEGLKEIDDWLEGYRRLWDERFEQLDDVLRDLQQEKGKSHGHHK